MYIKSLLLATTLTTAQAAPLTPHVGGLLINPKYNNTNLENAEYYIKVNPKTLKPIVEDNCTLFEDLNPGFSSASVNKSFTWGCVPINNRLPIN